MKLVSRSFDHGAPLHDRLAFCTPDPETHVTLSDNLSPHLAWSDLPEGTRSLVLICHDPDVPSVGDDVNQEGKEVPASLARVDFYHWSLVDLDPTLGAIDEGAFSSGVTAKGKSGPEGPHGTRQGINNYTQWFGDDADMGGHYFGYDGPCPPWNDTIIHHYHFTLYATDLERCPVEGAFEASDVLKAIEGHVLGQAALMGTFTLNPSLR
jgi:Raf kinase inhibitor-like YbhB/YbcL family protein